MKKKSKRKKIMSKPMTRFDYTNTRKDRGTKEWINYMGTNS